MQTTLHWQGLDLEINFEYIGDPSDMRPDGNNVEITEWTVEVGGQEFDTESVYCNVDVSKNYYVDGKTIKSRIDGYVPFNQTSYFHDGWGKVYHSVLLADEINDACLNAVYGN